MTYHEAVEVLGLQPDDSRRLMDLIVDRYESSHDARELALRERAPIREATKAADATVDEQIRAEFGDAVFAVVQQMLREGTAHSQVQTTFAPAMREQGLALSAQQSVSLAHVLWSVFSVQNNPEINAQRLQIDPATGLSVPDKQALQGAASFLSPAQLQVLSARLATMTSTNRATTASAGR